MPSDPSDVEGLRRRLASLKGAGEQTEPPALETAASLRERLNRLGYHSRRRGVREPALDDAQVAERVGGTVTTPGLIEVDRRVPLRTEHGRIALQALTEVQVGLPEAENVAPERLVFMDTETTGLAGGTGTVVFVLGAARLEAGALRVRQHLITRVAAERELLTAMDEWLTDDAVLVTFNGKRFDVPVLNARCRLAGVDDRFGNRGHLDLLYPVRRAYRSRWPDCRLATAERELLGFEREDDLPGSMAPEAWLALLQRQDPGQLGPLLQHNHWDLVSLAGLFPAINSAHLDPAAWGADAGAVARAHRSWRGEGQARAVLSEAEPALDEAGLLELARLHRRQGDWSQAHLIWKRLADAGNLEASERLAKYYEHVTRDYARALDYATRLPSARAQRRIRRLHDKRAKRDGTVPSKAL